MMDFRVLPVFDWTQDMCVFAGKGWLSAFSPEYAYLEAYKDGKPYGIIPYTIKRRAGLAMLQFHSNPIPLSPEMTEEEFITALPQGLALTGADFVAQQPTYLLFGGVPKGAKHCRFGSYVLDLGKTEEELWQGINGKHRNVIRKATASVEIKFGAQYLPDAAKLITATMRRSEMPDLPAGLLEKISKNLGDNLLAAVAYCGGKPQGCAILPFSRHSAYYLYGGSALEPAAGAMNLLHWEALRKLRADGVRRYDFVGARLNVSDPKLEGIQRFKSRFGGELKTGYLWKLPVNRLKYSVFSALNFIRTRGMGDIIDQESE